MKQCKVAAARCLCGINLTQSFPFICGCGRVWSTKDAFDFAVTLDVKQTVEPAKRSYWVKLVAILRTDADAGVGDTVQRIAAKFGGERFKTFAQKIGIPCGCTERQAEWNERYPYT